MRQKRGVPCRPDRGRWKRSKSVRSRTPPVSRPSPGHAALPPSLVHAVFLPISLGEQFSVLFTQKPVCAGQSGQGHGLSEVVNGRFATLFVDPTQWSVGIHASFPLVARSKIVCKNDTITVHHEDTLTPGFPPGLEILGPTLGRSEGELIFHRAFSPGHIGIKPCRFGISTRAKLVAFISVRSSMMPLMCRR